VVIGELDAVRAGDIPRKKANDLGRRLRRQAAERA